MDLYATFLDKVYLNIRSLWKETDDGQAKYKLKALEGIDGMHDQMEKMREEGRMLKAHELSDLHHSSSAASRRVKEDVTFRAIKKAQGAATYDEQFDSNTAVKVSKSDKMLALTQLDFLKRQGAAFDSVEEERYLLELLQLRAHGPPAWNAELESQFRAQLEINCSVTSAKDPVFEEYSPALHEMLDGLQDVMILQRSDETNLASVRQHAVAVLLALEGEQNITIVDENARQMIQARLVRKNDGAPYWTSPDDDQALEKLLQGHAVSSGTTAETFTGSLRPSISKQFSPIFAPLAADGGVRLQVKSQALMMQDYMGLAMPNPTHRAEKSLREMEAALREMERHNAFNMPSDQPVDVSHVRSMIDCGQYRKKPRKKRKKFKRGGDYTELPPIHKAYF